MRSGVCGGGDARVDVAKMQASVFADAYGCFNHQGISASRDTHGTRLSLTVAQTPLDRPSATVKSGFCVRNVP